MRGRVREGWLKRVPTTPPSPALPSRGREPEHLVPTATLAILSRQNRRDDKMPTIETNANPRENGSRNGLTVSPLPFCRQKSHDATKCRQRYPIINVTTIIKKTYGADDSQSRSHPALTSPSTVVFLSPYLRCETGHQPPFGVAGSFDFVVAVQRRVLSPPESPFASGFLPSTTTDFLAPRGNCVHHADFVVPRRRRISVSHQTDSRVPRTLAINRRGPRSFTSAAAVSSQALRSMCAGSTLASAGRNEFENG
ncbi:hypothetical protein PLANPX_6146 [Lacipirellula parvula]|uniref:Uncharacterized protein n=1 Tax=Lacipirellula parvula TaxID=2650471 RepID=A0A5K7XI06_9BACT|nr:hypothetical protein PLANPX_6146 [Lacipirellula parvula]